MRLFACSTVALCLAVLTPCVAQAQAPAQTGPAAVILVRHAEKATVGGADPSLSTAGQARAKALAVALADANVTAVITTTFKRTIETADTLLATRRVKLEKIAIEGTTANHVNAIADAVRKHAGQVVLVVGHSNTIPAIVTALGGPKLPDLCDAAYATMFYLVPGKDGKPASVVRAKYGAADPTGAESCTTPMP